MWLSNSPLALSHAAVISAAAAHPAARALTTARDHPWYAWHALHQRRKLVFADIRGKWPLRWKLTIFEIPWRTPSTFAQNCRMAEVLCQFHETIASCIFG
jgi:hypothetical protein